MWLLKDDGWKNPEIAVSDEGLGRRSSTPLESGSEPSNDRFHSCPLVIVLRLLLLLYIWAGGFEQRRRYHLTCLGCCVRQFHQARRLIRQPAGQANVAVLTGNLDQGQETSGPCSQFCWTSHPTPRNAVRRVTHNMLLTEPLHRGLGRSPDSTGWLQKCHSRR